MTAYLTTLAVMCAVVGGYVFMWRRAALIFARREVDNDIRSFPTSAADRDGIDRFRRDALALGLLVGAVWPVYLGWLLLAPRLDKDLPDSVAELKARNDAAEAELRQLRGRGSLPHDPIGGP